MPAKRAATKRKQPASSGILLRYRDTDTAYGVTRKTASRLAKTLGLSETQVIHVALANFATLHVGGSLAVSETASFRNPVAIGNFSAAGVAPTTRSSSPRC